MLFRAKAKQAAEKEEAEARKMEKETISSGLVRTDAPSSVEDRHSRLDNARAKPALNAAAVKLAATSCKPTVQDKTDPHMDHPAEKPPPNAAVVDLTASSDNLTVQEKAATGGEDDFNFDNYLFFDEDPVALNASHDPKVTREDDVDSLGSVYAPSSRHSTPPVRIATRSKTRASTQNLTQRQGLVTTAEVSDTSIVAGSPANVAFTIDPGTLLPILSKKKEIAGTLNKFIRNCVANDWMASTADAGRVITAPIRSTDHGRMPCNWVPFDTMCDVVDRVHDQVLRPPSSTQRSPAALALAASVLTYSKPLEMRDLVPIPSWTAHQLDFYDKALRARMPNCQSNILADTRAKKPLTKPNSDPTPVMASGVARFISAETVSLSPTQQTFFLLILNDR